MRAAMIHEFGGPDVLRVEEVPDPVAGPHEIVVRQSMTTINQRDIWIRKGRRHPAFEVDLPALLGVDICGEVVETGGEVDFPAVGDRVTINPLMPCGKCRMCRRDRPQYCSGFTNIYRGSYAELAVVPAKLAIVVPKHLPDVEVACFANNYPTAWEMLVRKAQVSPEDTVFVWAGTGGLAWAGVEIARLSGARVITSAGSEEKRDILRERGLEVLDHHDPGMVEAAMEATDGEGPSVVFEHVGSATWERSVEMCSPGGTVVSAGATTSEIVSMDVITMFAKQLRILGSRDADMASALGAAEYLSRGAFDPIVGGEFPLREIAEAHRLLEGGAVAGKVLVKF